MHKCFVPTQNFKLLTEAQRAVDRRGAAEAGLVVITGPFGVGKTAVVTRWAVDTGAVFVRCCETWTKRALLDQLATHMGLDTRGRNSEVQSRIIGRVMVDMKPLVFDEADFLIRSTPALLECVRDITDYTGVASYLVGMDRFEMKLGRYGHIASRVARVVRFSPITVEDVAAAVAAQAEVRMTPEVVATIHSQAGGRMRLVLNAISTIEQWAATNGWGQVTAEHIKGRQLCTEFKPGVRA